MASKPDTGGAAAQATLLDYFAVRCTAHLNSAGMIPVGDANKVNGRKCPEAKGETLIAALDWYLEADTRLRYRWAAIMLRVRGDYLAGKSLVKPPPSPEAVPTRPVTGTGKARHPRDEGDAETENEE